MAFSLFGASEEKFLGLNFIEFFQGSDQKRIEDLLVKIGDGPPEISDKVYVRLNGTWVSLNVLLIENHIGRSVIVIVTPLRNTSTPQ